MLEIKIEMPGTNKEIIKQITKTLKENDIYIAVFSHITSIPAVILPVEEIIKACHDNGALALVDGAHAIGAIPVDVKKLGADFWLSNGHKWLFTPKGSAVLYVKRDR